MIKMMTNEKKNTPRVRNRGSLKSKKDSLMKWVLSRKPENLNAGYMQKEIGHGWVYLQKKLTVSNDLHFIDSDLKNLRSELEYKFLQNQNKLSTQELLTLEKLRLEFNKLTKDANEAREVDDAYEIFKIAVAKL